MSRTVTLIPLACCVFLLFATPSLFATDGLKQSFDTVKLRDGTVYRGSVVELGGNRILVEIGGGAKKLFKNEVESVRFAADRELVKKLDSDLVVLKSGHTIAGEVKLLDKGRWVQVVRDDGSRFEYARSAVSRVLRKDEPITSTARYYTRQLEQEIDNSLKELRSADDRLRLRAESFLKECGIFAIDRVRAAQQRAPEDSAEAAALRRIARVYAFKEIVTTAMEEEEPRIYEILSEGDVEAKAQVLKALFPNYLEDSVELSLFLIKDPAEDDLIRSLAVDFLRRTRQNRVLLDLYNETVGEIKLIAAIALARNRILLGVPTLLEALSLEVNAGDIRKIAAETLRTATGKDFKFRADGAPAAREEAVARWRGWWQENQDEAKRQAIVLLNNAVLETPERKTAREIWRKARETWDKKEFARAEALLREAVKTDPSFFKASIGLAVLLYSDLERVDEAENVLRGLLAQGLVGVSETERHWIHLELANVLNMQGRFQEALESYEEALSLDARSVFAALGEAECHWRLATGKESLSPEERREHALAAISSLEGGRRLIEQELGELALLRAEDLPTLDALPFERRSYNRTLLALRRDYEADLIRLHVRLGNARALLGERKSAVLSLREALDRLTLSADLPDAKKLEVEIRSALGTHYEAMGKQILALKEYRRVVRDLEPTNEHCRRGLERLRRTVNAGK